MPYLLVLGVPFGLAATGFFIDKTGEGVNDASNAVIKLAAAGAIGFFALKKAKVI
jgi:hypothetical protein